MPGSVAKPGRIRAILCKVTGEVWCAIVPPDRSAFAQRPFCRINRNARRCDLFKVTLSVTNSAPRVHEFPDKPRALVWLDLWIAFSPETTPHDDIAAVRRFENVIVCHLDL